MGHGGKRKGAGRPLGSRNKEVLADPRVHRVSVYLSGAELKKLTARARAAGAALATYAHSKLVRGLR